MIGLFIILLAMAFAYNAHDWKDNLFAIVLAIIGFAFLANVTPAF